MTNFDAYAKYYDLFYRDKDYDGEVDYVEGRFRAHLRRIPESILDLGCGSGRHALAFGQRGYEVHGIDRSSTMLALAESRKHDLVLEKVTFSRQDATDFCIPRSFDVVTCLFHVINYQAEDRDLAALLGGVHRHLVPGGVFVFDFWYGPAVLHQLPETRVKRLEDEQWRIVRIAEPSLDENRNRVDVDYEVMVTEKATGQMEAFTERHTMRYLFFPEIERLLAESGFRILADGPWMAPERDLSIDTWSGEVVARKEA